MMKTANYIKLPMVATILFSTCMKDDTYLS
jgi:hypothetical protein